MASKEEILAGLAEIVNEETGLDTAEVQPEKSFTDDLDIDSISMMTIVVNAEDKFGVKIPDEEVKNLKTVQDAVDFIDQAQANRVGGDLAFKDPVQGLGVGNDVGQQVVHFQYFDAAFTHLGDEVEVVAFGLVDPDNVVEQQFVAVARGQALVRQAWRANHHFAQFAGFGVDAKFGFFRAHFTSPVE